MPFFFKQWGEWLPWEEDAQPPFYNSQNGQTIDGHRFPDFNETEVQKRWDDGLIAFSDSLEAGMHVSQCVFQRVGKKAAGRLLDGRTWDEFPEVNHGHN